MRNRNELGRFVFEGKLIKKTCLNCESCFDGYGRQKFCSVKCKIDYQTLTPEERKEHQKIYGINYRKRHPEKWKESKHKWNSNPLNKSKLHEMDRTRRANKYKIIELFTERQWLEKKKQAKEICPSCKSFVGDKLTLDHKFPLAKAPVGFLYDIGDIQPLCKSCNCKKHTTET